MTCLVAASKYCYCSNRHCVTQCSRAESRVCWLLFSLFTRRLERADVRLHCELPSGSGAGQPQTQGPKWCDKRCAGSPSSPGWATERVSPLCQPAGTLTARARVVAAKPCVTGWDAWYTDTHIHTNINTHAYAGMCKYRPVLSYTAISAHSHLHTALSIKQTHIMLFQKPSYR